MTPPAERLRQKLVRRINTDGPLTVADFMTAALLDPTGGYYQRQQVFGAAGDFITAPEISQMFGEMIGLWLMEMWQQLGAPDSVNIVEFGPGNGTLMADALSAAGQIGPLARHAQFHFIEASAQLKGRQRKKLNHLATCHWHADSTLLWQKLNRAPLLVIGNEFLDALPIHQFMRRDGRWLERCITVNEQDQLSFCLTPAGAQVGLISDQRRAAAGEGDIAEICPAAISIIGDVSTAIKERGGAALFIDYGYGDDGLGDSLQALRDHRKVPPLTEPGSADLTAHVNFSVLQAVAHEAGLRTTLTDQGPFLMQRGIGVRAQQLAEDKNDRVAEKILSSLIRLTAPDQMGRLFKVLQLGPMKL